MSFSFSHRVVGLAVALALVTAAERAHGQNGAQTPEPGANAAGQEAKPQEPIRIREKVEVQGELPNPYTARRMNGLTRSDTPLNEVPRSIQILDAEQIQEVNAKDLRDLYRHMVGVSTEAFMGQFFSRGFRTDHTLFFDGARGGNLLEHYTPLLNNVERVENHRGPSGVMFGPQENPGGLINIVTKRPQPQFDGGIRMQAGPYAVYPVIADLTGRIDKAGRLLYRLDASSERSPGYRDNTHVSDFTVVPSLAYVVSPNTRFDLQVTAIKDKKNGYRDRGLPFLNHRIDQLPIERSYQEKTDVIDSNAVGVFGSYSQQFAGSASLDVQTRYFGNSQDVRYHEPDAILADGRTMARHFRWFDKTNDIMSFRASLGKGLALGRTEHWLNASVDYSDETETNRFRITNAVTRGGQVPSIDLFNPVYGVGDPSTYLFRGQDTDTTTNRKLAAVVVQEQATIADRLHLLGSLRLENYEDTVDNLNVLTNVRALGNYSDFAVGFRTGALYQVAQPLGLFMSYDEAYEPQTPASQAPTVGGPFDPQQTHQWEAGAKTQWLRNRVTATATYYDIVKTNVLQTSLVNTTQLEVLGEVQSRGVEVELTGRLSTAWRAMATFSRNDIEITKDRNRALIGTKPTPQPPDKTGSLWVTYQPMPAWNLGTGMNYVDSRVAGGGGLDVLPSYARWDANVGYNVGQWRFRLFLENLTDKRYFTGGYGDLRGGLPAAPRHANISVEFRF